MRIIIKRIFSLRFICNTVFNDTIIYYCLCCCDIVTWNFKLQNFCYNLSYISICYISCYLTFLLQITVLFLLPIYLIYLNYYLQNFLGIYEFISFKSLTVFSFFPQELKKMKLMMLVIQTEVMTIRHIVHWQRTQTQKKVLVYLLSESSEIGQSSLNIWQAVGPFCTHLC